MGLNCSSNKIQSKQIEWSGALNSKKQQNLCKFFPTFDCNNGLGIKQNDDILEWVDNMQTDGELSANLVIVKQELNRINSYQEMRDSQKWKY